MSIRLSKAVLFCVLLLPAILLTVAIVDNNLGPDPAEALADETGEWALRLLLLTLAITPLRNLTGFVWLTQFRRMTGLYAFFYTSLHLLVFFAFLLGWQWGEIYLALVERPYISAGFVSFLLMLPLAITSTSRARRKMRRKWTALHRLVYPCAMLALLHLWWQVRSDYGEALVYVAVFVILLLMRKWHTGLVAMIRRGR